MPRTATESPKEYGSRSSWSEWVVRMREEGAFAEGDLANTFRQREELAAFIDGSRKPTPQKAFSYGETFGTRLRYVAGVTGLYAGGHVAETIRFLNEVSMTCGQSTALIILASLPLIVDYIGTYSEAHASDIVTARDVASIAFSKYRQEMSVAWARLQKNRDAFQRGSDFTDDAFYRFYKIARSLEQASDHEPRDARDACFPGILLPTRSFDRELSDPERMFYALSEHESMRDMYPPLKRESFDYWLEYGPRLRLNVRYKDRTCEEVDVTSRSRA